MFDVASMWLPPQLQVVIPQLQGKPPASLHASKNGANLGGDGDQDHDDVSKHATKSSQNGDAKLGGKGGGQGDDVNKQRDDVSKGLQVELIDLVYAELEELGVGVEAVKKLAATFDKGDAVGGSGSSDRGGAQLVLGADKDG